MSFFFTLAESVVPLAGIMKRKVIGDCGQRAVKKLYINDLDLKSKYLILGLVEKWRPIRNHSRMSSNLNL